MTDPHGGSGDRMSSRQRVMAALEGRPVDRVPLAFWLHNFATENPDTPEALFHAAREVARRMP